MLLQEAAHAAATHPLANTPAAWLWAIPLLPLAGFVINGLLSLVPAYHAGPADPTLHGHGHGDDHALAGEQGAHAHGDDHHPVAAHKYAGIASIVGPLVLALAFVLAVMAFFAMRGVGEMHAPFIQHYFSWIPVGDLQLDAAFQLDQLSIIMTLVITGVGTLFHIF